MLSPRGETPCFSLMVMWQEQCNALRRCQPTGPNCRGSEGCVVMAKLSTCCNLAHVAKPAITSRGLNDLESRLVLLWTQRTLKPLWIQDVLLSLRSSCICLHHRWTVGGGWFFLWSDLFGARFAQGATKRSCVATDVTRRMRRGEEWVEGGGLRLPYRDGCN